MSRISSVIRKELIQLRRDKKMRAMVFIAPVMQVLILGYAANMDVHDVPLAVLNQDASPRSRELVTAFRNSAAFTLKAAPASVEELKAELDAGSVEVGLLIPHSFGSELDAGRSPELQILVDGSRSNTAAVSMAYAVSIATAYGSSVTSRSLHAPPLPSIDARTRVWYNPELQSRLFMVPGIFALLAMVFTIILTSLAIVKEKEVGTLEQLMVSPLGRGELVIGKLAPFLIVSTIILSLALVAVRVFFGIVPRGSILLLALLSIAFALSTLGIGLFVSTLARTQQQAMMFSIFFFMFPMMILSGFVFPIANMPPAIQLITYIMPLRYYLVIVRGLFLKGVGIDILWPQLLPLLAIGTAVIGISVARFHKQLD
ncbi:MAG TPA: ABC transporter permease [Rectinemataceae bacterium]|nr:ABC transporter permease [Rectinemataceae bacterium]